MFSHCADKLIGQYDQPQLLINHVLEKALTDAEQGFITRGAAFSSAIEVAESFAPLTGYDSLGSFLEFIDLTKLALELTGPQELDRIINEWLDNGARERIISLDVAVLRADIKNQAELLATNQINREKPSFY